MIKCLVFLLEAGIRMDIMKSRIADVTKFMCTWHVTIKRIVVMYMFVCITMNCCWYIFKTDMSTNILMAACRKKRQNFSYNN